MSRWGAPPWRVDTCIAPTSLPPAADVVIIGAGLTGLATAWALGRAGVRRVVVVDQGRVGDGASGRTGGIVLEGTAIGDLPGVDACIDELRALVAAADIACDLQLDGCWELGHGDGDSPGGALPWHDGGAILSIRDTVPGGTVDPGALLGGLCRVVQDVGVTLHEEVSADRIEPRGDGVRVTLGSTTIDAGHAVLAMNAYTPILLSPPQPFQPALTLALCTEPLAPQTLTMLGLADRFPFYTVDLPYLWGRVLADDRIVFGAGLVFAPGDEVRRIEVGQREVVEASAHLESRVRELHPALTDVAMQTRWGGPVALRRGSPPILARHPESDHMIVTGGYSGHGVALGVRMGTLAAAAVTDGGALPEWGAFARVIAPIGR